MGVGGYGRLCAKSNGSRIEQADYYSNSGSGKKGNSFLIETFTDKEKLELFTHLFKYEPWKNLPSQRKKELLSRKGGFARSVAISAIPVFLSPIIMVKILLKTKMKY
jgi:hypothetical protein